MKTNIAGIAIAAALLFVSATDWDGVATIDPSGDLPGGGYSIATNAFPKNTVMDVTNLENNRRVRVIVVSGLGNPGLLATLSRFTAEALDIRGDSVSRIRMSQIPDDIAYSYLRQLGIVSTAEASTPEASTPLPPMPEPSPAAPPLEPERAPDIRPAAEAIAEAEAETDSAHSLANLILIPSDERIPESAGAIIAEENMLPPIAPPGFAAGENEYTFIEGIRPADAPTITAASAVPHNFSPFQAPLISELERNKWYVQIAAYTRSDNVEDEISRIGNTYPMAVQNIGTDTSPMFRVLLGPMNQGESGAVLQRVKSIGYKDAFVRRN